MSGQKMIKMEVLKELMAMPGIKNIVTYIQSGNIAFDATETDADVLKKKIEKKILKNLGFEVPALVRTVDELKAVIAENPFDGLHKEAEKGLYVNFLGNAPDKEKLALLKPYLATDEQMILNNKELYLLTPKYGNTKLTIAQIEKKLGTNATARNWNTVNKMIAL